MRSIEVILLVLSLKSSCIVENTVVLPFVRCPETHRVCIVVVLAVVFTNHAMKKGVSYTVSLPRSAPQCTILQSVLHSKINRYLFWFGGGSSGSLQASTPPMFLILEVSRLPIVRYLKISRKSGDCHFAAETVREKM